jgi:hypothetical protein
MAISSDAIAGFVGVVTGSVITGGFQYLLAARSDRRESRAARRLLLSELRARRKEIEIMQKQARWDGLRESIDPSEWQAHRNRLAIELPNADWMALDIAYRSIRIFTDYLVVVPPNAAPDDEVVGEVLLGLKEADEQLTRDTLGTRIRLLARRPAQKRAN